ncbi:MAG: hypothetical protein ACYS30_20480, partial [Planctomycetota bacterium]
MAERRPENFLQVLTESLGAGFAGVARQKEIEQREALPNAMALLGATLRIEEAERKKAASEFTTAQAKANIELANLRIDKLTRELATPVLSEEAKLELQTDLAIKKQQKMLELGGAAMEGAEPGEQFLLPSGVKAVTPPLTAEQKGVQAGVSEIAKRGVLREAGEPLSLAGGKTLSAKDQWYKTYLTQTYGADEAAVRFADYINPETGPEEKKEYFRILRSQLGGIFVDPSDPLAVKDAEGLAMKTTGWLPEYEGKVRDVIAGLKKRLDAGDITQDQY